MADQPMQHDAVERERQGRHARGGEGERRGQGKSQCVRPGADQSRGEGHPLAEAEVDDARGAVHHHEGQRHQSVDGAGEDPVHEQRDEEEHGRGRRYGSTPSIDLPRTLCQHRPESRSPCHVERRCASAPAPRRRRRAG